MIFRPTPIEGAFLVELEPHEDSRGSFARSFCLNEFKDAGIDFNVAQCNLARTREAGTVRGLHYQEAPAAEQKLVRCLAGGVLDVIIDMRPESTTWHKTFNVTLNPENRLALFIPGGIAHGYQALEDNTEFFYMTDEFYSASHEKGVRFDDPIIGPVWPIDPRNVTDRDQKWPTIEKNT